MKSILGYKHVPNKPPAKIRRIPLILSLQPFIADSLMTRPTYQSFRLLLYLEWLLLAAAVLTEILWRNLPLSLLLRILTIAAFGLMGLRLPTGKLRAKVLYTALEFSLILVPAIQSELSTRSVFLLSLVLVMRSCIIFRRLGQFSVVSLALSSLGVLILAKPITSDRFRAAVWDWRLSSMLLFGLTLVFASLLINALLAERQSREQLENTHKELEIAHEQLRQYALRIEDQATLQERNRIAREIHDGLGHTLAAQTIQMNNALLFWQSNTDKALAFLKQAKQLGSEALLEVRRSVSVLRSNPLQGQSIQSAIEKLLTDFKNNTEIEPSCKIYLPSALPIEVSTTFYRIVQESLTNICKHAQATAVTVQLCQQAGVVHLSIEDNGIGFNPAQNTTGFGLQGMRERATALGGEFHLFSQPGIGCQISVSVPLSKLLL